MLVTGIGQSVVIGPIYIAEVAPAPIRGLATCFFSGFAYLSLIMAYFVKFGAALHQYGTMAQWASRHLSSFTPEIC